MRFLNHQMRLLTLGHILPTVTDRFPNPFVFTAAWLAQLGERQSALSGRSRVQTPAGPTLRVFK